MKLTTVVPILLIPCAFYGVARVSNYATAPAPRCPVAKVRIGMTWDELLRVCPGHDDQWGDKVVRRYKLDDGELREDTDGDGAIWLGWANLHDAVALRDGRVTYATENVP